VSLGPTLFDNITKYFLKLLNAWHLMVDYANLLHQGALGHINVGLDMDNSSAITMIAT
jgi:hypothetical protein